MKVLALTSQKSGSGKTTLAGHLAVATEAAGAGPVALIDADPQGSLTDWWNERQPASHLPKSKAHCATWGCFAPNYFCVAFRLV